MMKDTLGMPTHNDTRGCCWLCNCTPDKVNQVTGDRIILMSGTLVLAAAEAHDTHLAIPQFLPQSYQT